MLKISSLYKISVGCQYLFVFNLCFMFFRFDYFILGPDPRSEFRGLALEVTNDFFIKNI